MAPKDVSALIPGMCKYVSLPGQRDFADVIKSRGIKDHEFSM